MRQECPTLLSPKSIGEEGLVYFPAIVIVPGHQFFGKDIAAHHPLDIHHKFREQLSRREVFELFHSANVGTVSALFQAMDEELNLTENQQAAMHNRPT